MFPIKKIFYFFCLLFISINGNAQNEFKLIFDKDFAVTNEFLTMAFLSDDIAIECAAYLVIKDNQGKDRIQMPGQLIGGSAVFKLQIPSNWSEGWYKAYVFTKDANSDNYAELCSKNLAIYDTDSKLNFSTEMEEIAITEIDCIASMPNKIVAQQKSGISNKGPFHIFNSLEVNKINSILNSKTEFLKNGDIAQRATKQTILLTIDDPATKKNFVAFYNSDKQKVEGLRKIENNIYSLEIDNIYAPINGQILSISAFGDIKFLSAPLALQNFELPEFIPISKPLPTNKEIGDYIERHKKRLIIMSLFDQEYIQLSKVSVDRNTDVIYYTKDYIQFNSTNEFINEVLQVVRYNDKKQLFSVLSEDKVFSKDPPLLLLNGKIVMNSKDILSINYKDIESIEIVRQKNNLRESFSTFGRNGVVSVFAKAETTKYESSYFTWHGNNKSQVEWNTKDGPNYSESVMISNDQEKSFSNASISINSTFENTSSKWQSKTCKVNGEL